MNSRDTQSAGRVAGLAAAMMFSAAGIVGAQTPTPAPIMSTPPRVSMIGTSPAGTMREEVLNPHQVLARAYRANIVAFATAMRTQAGEGKAIDLDIARPAMTEMRRSFDKMKEHQDAYALSSNDTTKDRTSPKETAMTTQMTSLGQHLTALEAVVGSTTPDAASITSHTSAILTAFAGMNGGRGMDKDMDKGMDKDKDKDKDKEKDVWSKPSKTAPVTPPTKPETPPQF